MAADVGQAAPELGLYDFDRQVRNLADHRGQTVVLAFFPGAFTGVCTTEMCSFRDRAEAFNSINATVYGISVDGPFALKAWADAEQPQFPPAQRFQPHGSECLRHHSAWAGRHGGLRGLAAGGVHRGRRGRNPLQVGGRVAPERAGLRRGAAGRRGTGLTTGLIFNAEGAENRREELYVYVLRVSSALRNQ